ncbi:MAG: AraC family transcriptional regulator [Ruminococcaceae bacterium]|nr:AraC family transcriptional regulator [Oscillospiraceae bacterium]
MDIRKFVLSYYSNATDDFHINEVTKPKGALALHSHDYFQIYYLKEGKIIHHLENSSAELSAGDVFIIPPNLVHYIEPSSQQLRFYSISFMPAFIEDVCNGNKFVKDFIHYLEQLAKENIPPSLTLEDGDALFADTLVQKVMKEFTSDKTGKEALIKSAIGLLLSVFARSYFNEKCESIKIRSEREAIMHCITYVKNHLSEEITLLEIAKKTAMSKTAFCKSFNTVVGESFKKYLNRQRIENASRLIKSGECASVAARLSGYSDFSTFYRNFKRIYGVCPSEYT